MRTYGWPLRAGVRAAAGLLRLKFPLSEGKREWTLVVSSATAWLWPEARALFLSGVRMTEP